MIKKHNYKVVLFEDDNGTGEDFQLIFKSAWEDHYIVVTQDVIDEYDPTVECLTKDQIKEKYKIDNIDKQLE